MFRLAQKENLIIPAHIDYLASLRDFITQIGKKYHFGHKFINTFKLAVDEAATNIIKHAYAESEGYITVQALVKSNSLSLKILDQGSYFDPKWAKDLDLKESVNTDEKMGLGIFMMRKLMDEVDYKKSDSGNELTLTKKDNQKKGNLRFLNLTDLPTTLKIRYLVQALLLVTILNGAGYYYYHNKASEEVKTEFIQEGKKLSKQVTQQLCAITPNLLNGPDGLSYVKAIILPVYDENLGRIYSLALEDSLGVIAWSTIPTELNSFFGRPDNFASYDANIYNYSIGGENEVYEFESELIFQAGEALYKKLHVLISSNYLIYEIKKQRVVYLKYTLISLGLWFIFIAFISYLVSHPIHKLTKWVRAASSGNLQDEMDIDATTEIGEIAQAFTDITTKFNQSQKHLADREEYEKEINLAKDIQNSLLPGNIPEIETLEISAFYQAAKTVGGDFYDFIEVDQDHIGIAIADVSGKGVPGSMMMTIIRTALRTEARGVYDAAEVLTRVNEFVVNDMKNGMFATIFYIIINTKTLVSNFASAGHNPLILYSRGKQSAFSLNPNGFPVGIKLPIKDYFAQNIKSETIQLAQDEFILLYTDGITEAMNPSKQLYGEERLIKIISKSTSLNLKNFAEKLKNNIYSFTEDGPLHDDITFIAIKPKKKTTNSIEFDPKLSVSVNFLSIEDSNKIISIVRSNPNLGAEEISNELNTKKHGKLKIEPERILTELSRRQLHTVSLRLKYVESKEKGIAGLEKPGSPGFTSAFTTTPLTSGTETEQFSVEEAAVNLHPGEKSDGIKKDDNQASNEEGSVLQDFIDVLNLDDPPKDETSEETVTDITSEQKETKQEETYPKTESKETREEAETKTEIAEQKSEQEKHEVIIEKIKDEKDEQTSAQSNTQEDESVAEEDDSTKSATSRDSNENTDAQKPKISEKSNKTDEAEPAVHEQIETEVEKSEAETTSEQVSESKKVKSRKSKSKKKTKQNAKTKSNQKPEESKQAEDKALVEELSISKPELIKHDEEAKAETTDSPDLEKPKPAESTEDNAEANHSKDAPSNIVQLPEQTSGSTSTEVDMETLASEDELTADEDTKEEVKADTSESEQIEDIETSESPRADISKEILKTTASITEQPNTDDETESAENATAEQPKPDASEKVEETETRVEDSATLETVVDLKADLPKKEDNAEIEISDSEQVQTAENEEKFGESETNEVVSDNEISGVADEPESETNAESPTKTNGEKESEESTPEKTEAAEQNISNGIPANQQETAEFDISEEQDISDLLVDSIFDKFLSEALGEDTFQTSKIEETPPPQKEPEETKSVELDTPVDPDVDKPISDSKAEADQSAQPEKDKGFKDKEAKPETQIPKLEKTSDKAEPKTETEAEKNKDKGLTKKASKTKKKAKAKQIKLKPFIAPSESGEQPLEYQLVLGDASELIGFEINEAHEFEDMYDLSSELDVEFKRELELEEYELVLDLRPDEDAPIEAEVVENTSPAEPQSETQETDTISETVKTEADIELQEESEIDAPESDELTTEAFQTEELNTEELADNAFADAILGDAINFGEMEEILSQEPVDEEPVEEKDINSEVDTSPEETDIEVPEETEITETEAPQDTEISTKGTDDFAMELFADMDAFGDDSFAQELAEFDGPEEKTPSSEPIDEKTDAIIGRPFNELQANEYEDVYKIRPVRSHKPRKEDEPAEAETLADDNEPKTEPLPIKTRIIEVPISEEETSLHETEKLPDETSTEPDKQEIDIEYLESETNKEEAREVIAETEQTKTEETITDISEEPRETEDEIVTNSDEEPEIKDVSEEAPIYSDDTAESDIPQPETQIPNSITIPEEVILTDEDDDTPIETEEISIQAPEQTFSKTPFTSLKTNEFEDKYAKDIELKQSKIILARKAESEKLQKGLAVSPAQTVPQTDEAAPETLPKEAPEEDKTADSAEAETELIIDSDTVETESTDREITADIQAEEPESEPAELSALENMSDEVLREITTEQEVESEVEMEPETKEEPEPLPSFEEVEKNEDRLRQAFEFETESEKTKFEPEQEFESELTIEAEEAPYAEIEPETATKPEPQPEHARIEETEQPFSGQPTDDEPVKEQKDELAEHLMTGVQHYKNRRYEDAIIFLKKVIKLDPNVTEAYAMLGNAYYRNRMLYEAIMAYEQLKPFNVKDPSIYENLGLIYWKLNQKEKAVNAWQSLLKLTPEREDIKQRISYLQINGTSEIKTQIRKISLKQNGSSSNEVTKTGNQDILKKAMEQYRSQDYKSAIDSLKLALKHYPDNEEVYTYLANAYFRNKMFDDAVKIYERLIQFDANNITVLENLGMLHLKLGAFKKAVTEWKKIIAKQPGRNDLKQKIAKVSALIENE